MPCMNCIDGICQSRCLPKKSMMLKQLKPKIHPEMYERFCNESIETIVSVYNQAFFSREALRRDKNSFGKELS